MRAVFGWILGVVIAFNGSAMARAAEDDAAAVVDKAIKAHGGAEKLTKFKADQWKVKGTIAVMDMKFPYTATYYFERPSLFRFDMNAEFGGMKIDLVVVYNGKQAWEKGMGMLREMEKMKFEEMQHQVYLMDLCNLLPLKSKDVTLAALGDSEINGAPAAQIKVTQKGKRDVKLFFDRKTGRLVKSESRGHDEFASKEVLQEVYFLDWKEKDGVLTFNKLKIHHDGKPFIEEEFSDQKSSEKLDPKLFEKP